MKYFLVHYDTHCGNYTFDHKFLVELEDGQTIDGYIDENLPAFWGDEKPEKEGEDSYSFNGGDLITSLVNTSELSEADYLVLKQFI